MPHPIKTGSRFNLCGVEMIVKIISDKSFRFEGYQEGDLNFGWLPLSGADSLDWIEPVWMKEEGVLEWVIKAANYATTTCNCCACHNAPEKAYINASAFIEQLREHKAK